MSVSAFIIFHFREWNLGAAIPERRQVVTYHTAHRRVTIGEKGGELCPAFFQKLEKSALILGKNALVMSILS